MTTSKTRGGRSSVQQLLAAHAVMLDAKLDAASTPAQRIEAFTEQLYGEKLTDTDLSNVGYSNVPVDNAWAFGPSDPKGSYYLMAWRLGHPCGQASGVRFSPGPDLPVFIDKADHPSVKLLK